MVGFWISFGLISILLGLSIFANYRQYNKQQILEEENENLAERVEEREDQMFEFARRVKHAQMQLKSLDTEHQHYEKDEDLGYFYRSVSQMIERLKVFDFVEEASKDEQAEYEFQQLNQQLGNIFSEQRERREKDISDNTEARRPNSQERQKEQDRKRRSFIPNQDNSNTQNRREPSSYGQEKNQEGENVLYQRNRAGYNRLHQLRQSSRKE